MQVVGRAGKAQHGMGAQGSCCCDAWFCLLTVPTSGRVRRTHGMRRRAAGLALPQPSGHSVLTSIPVTWLGAGLWASEDPARGGGDRPTVGAVRSCHLPQGGGKLCVRSLGPRALW